MTFSEDYVKDLRECIDELSHEEIERVTGLLFEAYRHGKRVFVMGNGGSATTAMHFARDLQIGSAVEGKPRLRTACLADNVAFITSIGNDTDYENVFREQLVGQMDEGDVVIGISASGNSPNVLRAIEYANANGAVTLGLIGFGGGKLKGLTQASVTISPTNYQFVEDIHMMLAHIIPFWLKEKIAE